MKMNIILVNVILICLLLGCNPVSDNPDNWKKITLPVKLNKEQLVYKIGDTLKLIVTVPDSLPSLTIQGEKVKVHTLNEAYATLDFGELDTINKRIEYLSDQVVLFAEKGKINIRKGMVSHVGSFENSKQPFGIIVNMIFNKKGLYQIRATQTEKFIANNGSYKVGVLYELLVNNNNTNIVKKHFDNVSNAAEIQAPYPYYVFYVQ